MPSLLILVQSDYTRDARIQKEARAARDEGFSVTIIAYGEVSERSVTTDAGIVVISVPYTFSRVRESFRCIVQSRSPAALGHGGYDDPSRTPTQVYRIIRAIPESFTMYGLADIHTIYEGIRVRPNPNIIHVADLPMLGAGVVLAKILGARLVYDAHELWIDSQTHYPPWLAKVLTVYEHHLIHHADAVITVNESIARILSERYDIPTPSIVRNTVPLHMNENTTPNPSHGDGVSLLYHGRLGPERDIMTLITGMSLLPPRYTLTLRGINISGPDSVHLREAMREISRRSLSHRVFIIPPTDARDVVAATLGYSIGIVPLRAENLNTYYALPNKVFEYMAAGCALVASSQPHLKDILLSYRNGALYHAGDPGSFASAVLFLGEDKVRLSHMRDASLSAVTPPNGRYAWEKDRNTLLSVYRHLLSTT